MDLAQEMLVNGAYQKNLAFWTVLMDSWYATKEIMLAIEKYQKIYYCPLKDYRQVDDSGGSQPYQRVDSLPWSDVDEPQGNLIKIKGFPGSHQVKLFRVALSPKRTDYMVINDMAQTDTPAVQAVCSFRWKVEQFHRETKQLTGLEGYQCRQARIIRNHLAGAILVWVRLKPVANETQQTVYHFKHRWLSDYLRQQLQSPTIQMTFA